MSNSSVFSMLRWNELAVERKGIM